MNGNVPDLILTQYISLTGSLLCCSNTPGVEIGPSGISDKLKMQRTTIFLLFLLSVFTLKDYVRGEAECLGLSPTIILECTTDYATPARILNVTWLLNSTVPEDIKDDSNYDRVNTCRTNINCGNGSHTDMNNNCARRNGWRFDDIPITEDFCNVTVEYIDSVDLRFPVPYCSNFTTCSFPDDLNTNVEIQDVMENRIVGDPYEIQCNAYTNHAVYVNITWNGPNNDTIVTNNRIIVNTNTSVGKNHTSTLQFLNLTEEDRGLYTCHVAVLSNTTSRFFKLEGLSIPIPGVNVTILNNKNTVGSKLSLECNVTTVSGVSSTAEIVWIKNGTMVEETSDGRISIKNDSIRISILQFLYLSEDDESDYTCNATIRDTSNSNSIKLNNFDIPNANVSITAVNQNVGDPISLRCDVSVVKGITSSVNITWMMGNGNELRSYNGNFTESTTAYTYYYNDSEKLTLNDNNTVYQCQVTINNRSLGNDNLTLNVSRASAPSDDTSSTATIVSIISVVVTLIFLCFAIFIGIYMYRTKRNKKIQISRGHVSREHEFEPFDDCGFSVIGKDDPSTCESLGANQKVKEWIKSFQMSDIDEECESVISATNEDMLNYVQGHTKKATQIADSGVGDSEIDSGLSLSKQNTYVSHKAFEDMCHDKVDKTINPALPSADDPYPSIAIGGNHNGRQALSYSTDTGSANTGNYVDRYVTSNSDVDPLLLQSTNESTLTTAASGSYIDHNTTSNSQPPMSHSNATTEEGTYVDPYITSNHDIIPLPLHSTNENIDFDQSVALNGDNANPIPLLHSTTSTFAVDGSYVDHDTTSNSKQPLSHSNITTAADKGSYVDRYVAINNNNSNSVPLLNSTTFKTAVDGSYVDNDASQPLSHPNTTTAAEGNYIYHYVTSNNDINPLPIHSTNEGTLTTTDEGSYIDCYVASSNDNTNPLHSTNSGTSTTAVDGSYVDHDTTFYSKQPLSHSNITTIRAPLIKNTSGYSTESDV